MAFKVSHDGKAKKWSISYKPHVFVAGGLVFITAGLAALTGPWWQPIVYALLGLANISASSTPQTILGVLLVIIGISSLAYKYIVVDGRTSKAAADKKTYCTHPLPIDLLRQYLNSLFNDHSYLSSMDTCFYDSFTYFSKPENSFQLQSTADKYKAYSLSAKKLHDFLSINFFIFPDKPSSDGDYRYCMHPEWNMDRGMLHYNEKLSENYLVMGRQLSDLIEKTEKSLIELANDIKERGHI